MENKLEIIKKEEEKHILYTNAHQNASQMSPQDLSQNIFKQELIISIPFLLQSGRSPNFLLWFSFLFQEQKLE